MSRLIHKLHISWTNNDNIFHYNFKVGIYSCVIIIDYDEEVLITGRYSVSKLSHTEDYDYFEYIIEDANMVGFSCLQKQYDLIGKVG